MTNLVRVLLTLVLLSGVCWGAVIPLDRFADAAAWKPHPDGGNAPAFSVIPAPAGRTGYALHLKYDDREPHWGNLARPISLPTGDGAISMWIYRHHAARNALLYLMLVEPDGDLWLSSMTSKREQLGRWRTGWHEVVVDLANMTYEGRGNKIRERKRANTLLIGCNSGDLEVSVADLNFEPWGVTVAGWEEWDEGLVCHARLDLSEQQPAGLQMLGAGWWDPEQDGRWTGRDGKPATLNIPAWPGRDYLVTLQVLGGAKTSPPALGAQVAGKPWPEHQGPRVNERWLLIPAEAIKGKQIEVTLGSPTFTPGGPDTRTLGLKVRALDVWAFTRTPAAKRLLEMAPAKAKTLALYVPPGHSPERTRRVLASWGYRVACLGPEEVVNPALLDPGRLAALVLMDDSWPARGQEAVIRYLSRGGHLFAAQGYAFDRLLGKRAGKWAETDSRVHLNTHLGTPRDALLVEREQVGAFDPAYPLDGATILRAAPDQAITGPLSLPCPVKGWGASALVASNNPVFPEVWARRVPLILAHDTAGRVVGSAVSLVRHYAGPWAGSSWLLCGVDSRSLLLEPRAAEALRRGLAAALRPVLVRDLATNWACYRAGEVPKVAFKVENGGDRPASLTWKVTAYAGSTGKAAGSVEGTIAVPAGGSLPVSATLPLPDTEPFYRLNCVLTEGNRALDVASTGLCFWRPEAIARGPRVTFADSYFRLDGQPAIICGTNQTGVMFASALENPLVWRRDFQGMADLGLRALRILHYSPFAMPGDPNLRDRNPEAGLRQLDAVIQLAQQAGVVVFVSLHDWIEVELDDARLAGQREWARTLAERYRDVPGVMFDVQNEPSVAPQDHPAAAPLWHGWLRAQYGNDAALAAAWDEPEATLDSAEVKGARGWDSLRARDFERFRVWLLNRWAGENIAGAKEARPDLPCTVGYLPWPGPADQALGAVHVDFSNMHYYGATADFPSLFKFSDQRVAGKGLSLGEFGVKAHPAWNRSNELGLSEAEGVSRLLDIVHYGVGLGGAMFANWDWKDMEECIFPWGLNHTGDLVPKDFALAFRDFSLLLRQWQPAWRPAPVYLLLADEHRTGGERNRVIESQRAAIDLLLTSRVPFDVITEGNLDRLPAEARAIVYPLPYCPCDAVVQCLEQFVRAGGSLYVSGDISFDPDRRRMRTDRLQTLCGVKLVKALASPLQEAPGVTCRGEGIPAYEAHPVLQVEPTGAEVLAAGTSGPIAFRHRLGAGQVFFTTDPVELHPEEGGTAVYHRFLALAQAPEVIPGLPAGWHGFAQAGADGSVLLLARNCGARSRQVTLRHAGSSVRVSVRAGGWALALVGPQGQVRAVEGTGKIRLGDSLLLETPAPVMLMQADEAGLRPGGPLVVMPLAPSTLTIPGSPPSCQSGEMKNGKWHALGEAAFAAGQGESTLKVTKMRSWLLLAPDRATLKQCGDGLAQILAAHRE